MSEKFNFFYILIIYDFDNLICISEMTNDVKQIFVLLHLTISRFEVYLQTTFTPF